VHGRPNAIGKLHARHLVVEELRHAGAGDGQDADQHGDPVRRGFLQKALQDTPIEYRLGQAELGAFVHLPLEPAHLLLEVERARIGADADVQSAGLAEGVPGDIQASVQVGDQPHQTD